MNYSFQSRSPLISSFVDQLLIETGPAGTHSVFEILQTHDRNSVHILLQSTPDSKSTGFISGLFGGQTEGLMKLGTFCCRNSTVNFARWRYTVFPIVFPVELGLLLFIFYRYRLLKIFTRDLHMILRIDYILTCVIHFKSTLLLEEIISWHVGGWFFMAHSVRIMLCICLNS